MVDDNIGFCRGLSLVLRSRGFDVDVVNNPFDAMDLIRAEEYNVVITDYVMPGGMDGLKLTKKIKAYRDDIPMVMITGNRSKSVEDEFKRLTGNGIVFDKIFDKNVFFDGLNTVMA